MNTYCVRANQHNQDLSAVGEPLHQLEHEAAFRELRPVHSSKFTGFDEPVLTNQ